MTTYPEGGRGATGRFNCTGRVRTPEHGYVALAFEIVLRAWRDANGKLNLPHKSGKMRAEYMASGRQFLEGDSPMFRLCQDIIMEGPVEQVLRQADRERRD